MDRNQPWPSSRRLGVVAGLLALVATLLACGTEQVETSSPQVSTTSTTLTTLTTSTAGEPVGGPATALDGEVGPAREVEVRGYQGWILDPDAATEAVVGTVPNGAEAVSLTVADVGEAEAIFGDELPQRRDEARSKHEANQIDLIIEDLPYYGRQYLGFVADGYRFVYVNAFCDPSVFEGGGDVVRLPDHLFHVDDGGKCYWQATVDLDRREVATLSVNGQA